MFSLLCAAGEGGCLYAFGEPDGCGLDACFVPKTCIDEALQQFPSAFHEEALYAPIVEVGQYLLDAFVTIDDGWRAAVHEVKAGGQYAVAVDSEPQRIGSRPVSCGEGRVVDEGSSSADEYSSAPCSQPMNKSLRQGVGEED